MENQSKIYVKARQTPRKIYELPIKKTEWTPHPLLSFLRPFWNQLLIIMI